MNRQERIDTKVAELFDEFEARLQALGFTTSHEHASDGKVGTLIYQEFRRDQLSCATCEESGTITAWFNHDQPPGLDGLYQVKRGKEVTFTDFAAGEWAGGAPDAWRGIDWRMSRELETRLRTVLRDRKHGSKPDAALALIRHHLCTRSNDRVMGALRDPIGAKEKVYYGVILRKDRDGAKQIGHLVNEHVVSKVPDDIRERIEQRIANFDLKRD